MEPKSIIEGGRNYGTAQRVGRVTFATVILRRGITRQQDLWAWFDLVTRQHAYASRLRADITVLDNAGQPTMRWVLENALATKFRVPDLHAYRSEIGVEELHVVHEGLWLERLPR